MRYLRILSLILCFCAVLAGCGLFAPQEAERPIRENSAVRPMPEDATLPQGEDSYIHVILPEQSEPAPTEPEPTNPSVSVLDGQNRELVNVFLSNFAEQGFVRYPDEDVALVHYAYAFAKVNKRSVLKSDGDVYYIDRADMDVILYDYFGRNFQPSGDPFRYYYADGSLCATFTGGRYEYPMADGRTYDYVAIATYMGQRTDGSYRVDFNIYTIPYSIDRTYYAMDAQELEATGFAYQTGSGHAVIRDHVRTNGKQSYLLEEYWLD